MGKLVLQQQSFDISKHQHNKSKHISNLHCTLNGNLWEDRGRHYIQTSWTHCLLFVHVWKCNGLWDACSKCSNDVTSTIFWLHFYTFRWSEDESIFIYSLLSSVFVLYQLLKEIFVFLVANMLHYVHQLVTKALLLGIDASSSCKRHFNSIERELK